MKTPGFRLFAAIAALYALPLAAQPRRIAGAIENSRRIALAGRVHRHATAQNDAGPVENTFVVSDMRLYLRPSGEAGLDQLLQEQQDPASPNYHKWLTPEQYGDRFGASADDTKQIAAWLESQGFTGVEVGRGRTWIRFSGTAQQVGNAFQTEVHRYNVRGVAHFANASDPTLPAAIAGVVSGISGLHDFRMEPRLRKVEPLMNTSFGHNLAPDDVATIYNIKPLLDAGIDGTGQRIAVVGQSAIRTSDIANFRSRFGLPAIDLQPVRVGRVNVPIRDGDVDEAHLDIEWSGAVARKATIVYYYADSVWDAAIEAVSRNTEKVISMSYGFCENADLVSLPQYRQIVQQAVAQGITWFAASGDSGAGDCEDRSASVAQNGFAVDSPGSIPEITAMGGTQFDDDGGGYWAASNGTTGASALGYIPERVWNTNGSGGIGGGGGGVSLVFPRPSWQAGLGPGGSGRMTPDISLNSASQHVGYFVYSGGIAYFGGTSVAAPLMAGVASLLNHYLVSTGAIPQAGLGNINPTLYRMAATPAGAEVFHDVVNGDNGVACVNGTPDCANGYFGHSAGPGYDLATGLGSIDAEKLVKRWTNHPAITSAVVPTIDKNPVFQSAGGWTFKVTLQEQAGVGTRLTDFTIDGMSRAAEIPALFGSAAIAPRGSVAATVTATGIAAPKTVVLGFRGVDASGAAWSTEYAVPFKGLYVRSRIGGVSNAASGQQVFAPGMILSVYGEGLCNSPQAAAAIPLPEYLAGCMAWVDNVAAPLYYVSSNQLNVQIPYETRAGGVTLEVGNPFENVTYSFNVTSAAPGIFTFADGRVNPSRAAARGQIATLFITGEGQVTPTLATGATPSARTALANLPKPRASYAVTVGGVPARVDFIGIPSGLVGVTQVNFEIPAGAAAGEQPVVVTVGGNPSNTAKIQIQ